MQMHVQMLLHQRTISHKNGVLGHVWSARSACTAQTKGGLVPVDWEVGKVAVA
jgi:hypothetical protein